VSLDGAFLSAIKREISFLQDGRVEKITQPSAHSLLLFIRAKGGNHRLFFCADPSAARIALLASESETPDAPKTPPNFCVLLRKHLAGGRLTAIRQDGLERIISFDFDTVTELGDRAAFTLCAEMIGNSANVILINADGKIVDAMRRVDAVTSEKRLILPNVTYHPPEKDERLDFRAFSPEKFRARLSSCGNPERGLIKIFEGISPVLSREWCFRAFRGNTPETLSDEDITRLEFFISKTAKELADGTYQPTVIKTKEGEPKDFSFIDIRQYGSFFITANFNSASEAVTAFYEERDRAAKLRQLSGDLYRFLLNMTERIAGRISAQKIELDETDSRSLLKTKGDLIAANLYRINDGDGSFVCENFYEEGSPEITVELDRRLTASKNMQRYYSEYKKAETRRKILTEQIKKGEEELLYIESVFDALTRAKTEPEIAELRAELINEGYLRPNKAAGGAGGKIRSEKSAKTGGGKNTGDYKSKKSAKAAKTLPPLKFEAPGGFEVLVGRNNTQNDFLTTKLAEKTDLWLHTKNIPGSHVILRTRGDANPPEEAIMFAAHLAAQNSKAANSSQVPVDVVEAKFVKKPNKSKPGTVIFTNNKTLYINPKS
jgi:predicted ribosome quality control (RQC) complex YloA/Tae2 family protein